MIGQELPLDPGLPRYNISELNRAIGSLLERGFAPRFLLDATVQRPQLKKGHLWMTLLDAEASISAVVWSSQLSRLQHQPRDGDGVVVVGKLNFWNSRASLCIQVLDIRPSLSSVLREFERVRARLTPEGLFEAERKRPLPREPMRVALLTSVPSSALADMLRTAAERWPAATLFVIPVPVQGPVEASLCQAVQRVGEEAGTLGLEALVLARGGGSREDLAVFDGERLARSLAACPIPVVTGLGHEDDLTIADLVADYRAATPTAAIVSLLPDREQRLIEIRQQLRQQRQNLRHRLSLEHQRMQMLRESLRCLHPQRQLQHFRDDLQQQRRVLAALSPEKVLARGFCLLQTSDGTVVHRIQQVQIGDPITVRLVDGSLTVTVKECRSRMGDPAP
ncbi:MAG: exodeoxyribonuclease VII large subunit [Cyanobacteriota bacterium]